MSLGVLGDFQLEGLYGRIPTVQSLSRRSRGACGRMLSMTSAQLLNGISLGFRQCESGRVLSGGSGLTPTGESLGLQKFDPPNQEGRPGGIQCAAHCSTSVATESRLFFVRLCTATST